MERNSAIYEIIIKFIYFIISFFLAIIVVKNTISMFPLFSSLRYSDIELAQVFSTTSIGKIFSMMLVSEYNNIFYIAKEALVAFISSLNITCIVFLIGYIFLLLLQYFYPKWGLIKKYCQMNLWIITIYIVIHIIFAISLGIFYHNSLRGLEIGMIIGTIFYGIGQIIILFFLSLFIIKFIFNIVQDFKQQFLEEVK